MRDHRDLARGRCRPARARASHAFDDRQRRIGRRRQLLVRGDLAGRIVEQREIGERAADVDADAISIMSDGSVGRRCVSAWQRGASRSARRRARRDVGRRVMPRYVTRRSSCAPNGSASRPSRARRSQPPRRRRSSISTTTMLVLDGRRIDAQPGHCGKAARERRGAPVIVGEMRLSPRARRVAGGAIMPVGRMPPPSRWRSTSAPARSARRRSGEHRRRCGAPSPLLRLIGDRVEARAQGGAARHAERDGRVEHSRAVEVQRASPRARATASTCRAYARGHGNAARCGCACSPARSRRTRGFSSSPDARLQCRPRVRRRAWRRRRRPRRTAGRASAAGAPASEVSDVRVALRSTASPGPREQHQRDFVGHRARREKQRILACRAVAAARARARAGAASSRKPNAAGARCRGAMAASIAAVGRVRKSLRRSTGSSWRVSSSCTRAATAPAAGTK